MLTKPAIASAMMTSVFENAHYRSGLAFVARGYARLRQSGMQIDRMGA